MQYQAHHRHELQLQFARQALADFEAWDYLQRYASNPDSKIKECHRMHFLQMACEKGCKAYLLGNARTIEEIHRFTRSHEYVMGTLPVLLKRHAAFEAFKFTRYDEWFVKEISQHIHFACPAIGADLLRDRFDNCEYPWLDRTDRVQSPLDHRFAALKMLEEPSQRKFSVVFRTLLVGSLKSIINNS